MTDVTHSPSLGDTESLSGRVDWSSPTNIYTSDNVRASVTLASQGAGWLVASRFGFAIPTGSTILGFIGWVEGSCASGTVTMTLQLQKQKNGGLGDKLFWTTTGQNVDFTTTEQTHFRGSSTDLAGETWTAEEVNHNDFSLTIRTLGIGITNTIRVDHMQVTVYYTPPTIHNGAAAVSMAVSQTATAGIIHSGAATPGVVLDETAAGALTLAGEGGPAMALTVAAVGQTNYQGTAAVSLAIATAAEGTLNGTHLAEAAVQATLAAEAAGLIEFSAEALVGVTFAGAAQGDVFKEAAAAVTITLTVEAASITVRPGAAIVLRPGQGRYEPSITGSGRANTRFNAPGVAR